MLSCVSFGVQKDIETNLLYELRIMLEAHSSLSSFSSNFSLAVTQSAIVDELHIRRAHAVIMRKYARSGYHLFHVFSSCAAPDNIAASTSCSLLSAVDRCFSLKRILARQ